MTGFAHANEISAAAIRRAGETLQLLDPAKGQPAPPPGAATAISIPTLRRSTPCPSPKR